MTTPPDVALVVAIALLFRSTPTGMDAALEYLTRTVNPIRLSVPGIIVSDPASIAVAVVPLNALPPVANVSDAFPLSIDGPDTTEMTGAPGANVSARLSVTCTFGAAAWLVFRSTMA